MRNFDLEQAIREWDSEVSRETARLIRRGTPPYDAIEKAKKIVTERRREAGSATERESE
jgi:hypothetical protein